jgi:hypothetical protein
MSVPATEGNERRGWRARTAERLGIRPKPTAGSNALVGKRARTRQELESEARAYVKARMYGKGGWREAWRGFWNKTLPTIIGSGDSINVRSVLILSSWALLLAGSAVVPVLGKRAIQGTAGALQSTPIDALVQIRRSLQPSDYLIAAAGLLFVGMPRMLTVVLRRRERSKHHLPYAYFAAAIRRTKVDDNPPQHSVLAALSDLLNALRIEMSELAGDGGRDGLTDVTLLEYCDDAGTRMWVTARTRVSDDKERPCDAYLFLANYVAREGRWFAENDFLSSRNPFKPTRLTVSGNPRVDYRSVLYLPILTASHEAIVGERKGPPSVKDYCLGVICVHSQKPYRFWRWGDQGKDNGGGSGNVAFERAVPYIALASKLIEHSAPRVPLEAGQS